MMMESSVTNVSKVLESNGCVKMSGLGKNSTSTSSTSGSSLLGDETCDSGHSSPTTSGDENSSLLVNGSTTTQRHSLMSSSSTASSVYRSNTGSSVASSSGSDSSGEDGNSGTGSNGSVIGSTAEFVGDILGSLSLVKQEEEEDEATPDSIVTTTDAFTSAFNTTSSLITAPTSWQPFVSCCNSSTSSGGGGTGGLIDTSRQSINNDLPMAGFMKRDYSVGGGTNMGGSKATGSTRYFDLFEQQPITTRGYDLFPGVDTNGSSSSYSPSPLFSLNRNNGSSPEPTTPLWSSASSAFQVTEPDIWGRPMSMRPNVGHIGRPPQRNYRDNSHHSLLTDHSQSQPQQYRFSSNGGGLRQPHTSNNNSYVPSSASINRFPPNSSSMSMSSYGLPSLPQQPSSSTASVFRNNNSNSNKQAMGINCSNGGYNVPSGHGMNPNFGPSGLGTSEEPPMVQNILRFYAIFLDNLHPKTDVSKLVSTFSKYGTIRSVDIKPVLGISSTYACIEYNDHESPERAVTDALNDAIANKHDLAFDLKSPLVVKFTPSSEQRRNLSSGSLAWNWAKAMIERSGECFEWRFNSSCSAGRHCYRKHVVKHRCIDTLKSFSL